MTDIAKIKIGTCAWSYDDWKGTFYPDHLPANQWLDYYARYLTAVENDSTFYHTPSPSVLGHWLDQTPEHFVFTCKMPKEITHRLRLRKCREQMDAFLEAMAPLRAKLGCVLIQLPPAFSVHKDEMALKQFLSELPHDFRYAVEFRHTDWHLPRIASLLEDHRICWAWNDITSVAEQNKGAFEFLPQTTDFLYVRLLGDLQDKYDGLGKRKYTYGSLLWPRTSSLESWKIKIEKHLPESERVLVFAGNHFEGYSPLTCQRLMEQFNHKLEIPAPQKEAANAQQQLDLL